ncbi:MAG: phage baseplate assembly protein V [Alphaproteobacteria bacterium]
MFDPEQGFNMNDIARRLANLVRIGSIKEVDYAQSLARVEIGDLLTDWLPWITRRAGDSKDWHPVDPEEQVVVLSPSGDLSQGVILPALYRENAPDASEDTHATHYKDGSTVSFNRSTGTFNADFKGDATLKIGGNLSCDVAVNVAIKAAANVSVEALAATVKAPQITLEGNTAIKGDISGTGKANLAGGGPPIARVGDTVEVTVGSGSSAGTWSGTIKSGSSKVTAG